MVLFEMFKTHDLNNIKKNSYLKQKNIIYVYIIIYNL